MARYQYNEIKPALDQWADDKLNWQNTDSQDVKGFHIGYYPPSGANWSYQMHVEVLTLNDGEKYLCETVRHCGELRGIIHYTRLEYLTQ